jgi:nitroreductase
MTRTTVDTTVITRAVALACRAPSLHNSQPWRWVAGSATVDLFADPDRSVASTGNSSREAIISCGTVLDHFVVAMAAAGWDTDVDQFPDPHNLDHLASIDFTQMDHVTQARSDRAEAILHRRTDRRPFCAPKDWPMLESVLRTSYDNDLAELTVLADHARARVAEASRLTEAARRYDLRYHESCWWTASFTESEGIPERALVSSGRFRGIGAKRRFPIPGTNRGSSAGVEDRAKIVLLSTAGDTLADALNCGQALSAVLLECAMAGLATCTVTHLTELDAGRDTIRELTPGVASVPQVLIRVGAEPVGSIGQEPTPRRPLRDVLEIHG